MEGGTWRCPGASRSPSLCAAFPELLTLYPSGVIPLKWTRPISGSAEPRSAPQAPLPPSPAAGCSAAI